MHSGYVRLGVSTQRSNFQWSRKTNRAPTLGSTQRRDMEQTLCICHPKNRKEFSTFSISKHILRSLTRQACVWGKFMNGKRGPDLGKGQSVTYDTAENHLSHHRAPNTESRNSDVAPTYRSPQGRMGSAKSSQESSFCLSIVCLLKTEPFLGNHLELTIPLPQALWHWNYTPHRHTQLAYVNLYFLIQSVFWVKIVPAWSHSQALFTNKPWWTDHKKVGFMTDLVTAGWPRGSAPVFHLLSEMLTSLGRPPFQLWTQQHRLPCQRRFLWRPVDLHQVPLALYAGMSMLPFTQGMLISILAALAPSLSFPSPLPPRYMKVVGLTLKTPLLSTPPGTQTLGLKDARRKQCPRQ